MSYEITEITTEPVLKALSLKVDGSTIVTARPLNGKIYWRVCLDDYDLVVDVNSHEHARRVLDWIGRKMSPARVKIGDPSQLNQAEPGELLYCPLNGGHYRLRGDGVWEFRMAGTSTFIPLSRGPADFAYPLTADPH